MEHIFYQVEDGEGGEYKIRVRNAAGGIGDAQDFGIAWWIGDAVPIAGDFDNDSDVDGDDLGQWELDYAGNGNSDANGDGDSDGEDFLAWQRNFGTGVPPLVAANTVPEPGVLLLSIFGLVFLPSTEFRRPSARCSRVRIRRMRNSTSRLLPVSDMFAR